MKYAGLIYDDSRHYIDHLGPFCALMGWPLIVCEDSVADLALRYYPDLNIIKKDSLRTELPPNIVSCESRPLIQAAFPGQQFKNIWLPHGNSDKGWNSPFFEALQEEDLALVYGQKMIDFMHSKKVYPRTFKIGNFRWQYFIKHRDFYKKINPISQSKSQFLYAPTWDDDCSLWESLPHLAKNLPNNSHLIVKFHPNTLCKFEVELEILMGRYAKHKNIIFVPEFPPIYPLLDVCHGYIGDMSSIGYDYLTFDRPLFFLNAKANHYLSRCGTAITAEQFKFSTIDRLSKVRKEAYNYTFESKPEWDQFHALCGI